MIAAATQATNSFALDNLPIGWFDMVFLAVLIFGFFRGRKNGMTKEFLPVLKWLALVIACGKGYQAVGQVFINIAGWGKTLSYILGYLCVAFVVYVVFLLLNKLLAARLNGSNFFGRGEYYLGMLSGVIRFACILLFALAFLNAPYYTAEDISKSKAYAARWFGGGEQGFSGDYFPTLQSVQEDVFKKSMVGQYIANSLGMLLIDSVPPDADDATPAPQKNPMIHIGN